MTLLEQLRASAGDPAVLIDLLARVLMVVAFFGLGNALLRLLASTVKEGAERTVTLVLRVAWSVLSVAALVLVATYTLGLTVAQPLYAWGGGLTGWLESRTVGVLAVVAGAYVALRLVHVVVDRLAPDGSVFSRSVVRRETLRRVLASALRVVIIVAAAVTVLGNLGVNVTALLAGVSILGLAVSFGAQSLVKDVITGFFILFEDQYGVGDVIRVNGPSGLSGSVEAVSLRTTVLRALDGTAHIIPNGQVEKVSVMSRSWAQVVGDVLVPYRVPADDAIAMVTRTAGGLYEDGEWAPRFLEPPQVLGVDRLGDNGVTIRVLMKVLPKEQWVVSREFLRRIKNDFDAAGVEFPFPQTTLSFAPDAAPIKVRGEAPSQG